MQERFFQGLPTATIEILARKSIWRLYHRHEEIDGPEGGDGSVFLVRAGLVGLAASSAHGEQFIGLLVTAGNLISLGGLSSPLRDVVRMVALTDPLVLYVLRADDLQSARRESELLRRRTESQIQRYVQALGETLLDFVFCNAATRFAHILARTALLSENSIVPLTHDELGQVAGLTRVQVTRFLGQLRARGLIACSRQRGILVPDPHRLLATSDWTQAAFQL